MNFSKIRLLKEEYDVCAGIYSKHCRLFKVLLSNICVFDCKYCVNSKNSDIKRVYLAPEELVNTFLSLKKIYNLNGLFLSSGIIKNADYTMELMLEAVRLLRLKYNYKGYIHLKILPGVSYYYIKEASKYADRLSINIEAPNKSRLLELSTVKDFKIDILRRESWISRLHNNQTTQLVVGAAEETDLEILKMVKWCYENFKLKRIYFSGFRSGKYIELKKDDCPRIREYRLYNIDFLIRKYGIRLTEIKEIMINDMLSLKDPKYLLAKNLIVDINNADYKTLIRIPGIGPKTAKKILAYRKNNKIKGIQELISLGVSKKAIPFVKIKNIQKKLNQS